LLRFGTLTEVGFAIELPSIDPITEVSVMKKGTCPKCGAASVYMRKAGIGRGDGGDHVYTGAVTKPTKLDDYACTACGYIESYIPDSEKLQAVEKAWSKVV